MRRIEWVGCVAASLALAGTCGAAGGTVTDQAVSLTYGASHWSALPAANLTGVDATGDPVYQTGWWYRAEGDTREYPLPAPDVEDYSPTGRITATWNNLDGKNFRVSELTWVLDHEGPSGGFYSIVSVTNNNATARSFTLFHFLDMDLAANSAGDSGYAQTPAFLEFSDSGLHALAYRAVYASQYQVGAHPALRDSLNDTAVTNLDGSGLPFGPGDATAAFQFGPHSLFPGSNTGLAGLSALFNPARRHVKGDRDGIGLPAVFGQTPDLSQRSYEPMRRHAGLGLTTSLPAPTATSSLAGTDDFDLDFDDEQVFRDMASGVAYVDSTPVAGAPVLPLNWKLSATGDFDFDGRADILWRNTTSQKLVIWTMNGAAKTGNIIPSPDQAVDANWEVAAAADFNGDGARDLLWYNQTSGKIVLWFMNSFVVRITGQFTNPSTVGNNNWRVLAVGDYGKGAGGLWDTNDILWQNDTSKRVVVWYMDQAGNRTSGTFTIPDTIVGATGILVGPR
jgi:hypothetical protein